MSELWVTNVYNQQGDGAPNFPNGATVTGMVTATTFKGGAEISSGTISATSVTAASGTFNGPVTIGGTLTYEDVTNIDSVGVITARQGIKVNTGGIDITGNIGLGGANYGTAGQVLTSGGSGANATWVDAGGGAEYSGISSGAITAGRAVTVAADGKLMGVTGTSAINGTSTVATSAATGYHALIYDTTNDKYVVFYVDSGNVGKAKVGTPSGTTITWGSAVTFGSNVINNSQGLYDACYDPHNNKCVVLFKDTGDSNKGKVCSGTVSGTSITFGTPVTVCADVMESGSITYCPNADHNYVIVGNDGSNSRTISNVGYNSGTNSSTWDNNVTLLSTSQGFSIDTCWDPVAEKICVAWYNATAGNGSAIAGTLSSNAVTWGTAQAFNATAVGYQNNIVHHAASGRNVIVFAESSGNEYAYACTATLSGTVFSFGSHTIISKSSGGGDVGSKDIGAEYDPSSKKILAAFMDGTSGTDDGLSVVLTVDGTTVTASNGYTFQTQDGIEHGVVCMAYDPDLERIAVTTWGGNTPQEIRYYVEKLMATSVTATNFVGISQASYTNGQTAKISLTGAVNEAVTGLTPVTKYYVLADGSLGTDSAPTGILAGLALASNRLYIRGW